MQTQIEFSSASETTAMLRALPLLLCLSLSLSLRAQDIKCPDTKDVWLSCAVKEEADGNGGKWHRMKLKAWQEFGLLDFDVSALKGKVIENAALFIAPDGGAVFGKERG